MNGFTAPEIEQAFISCLMQWPGKTFALADHYKLGNEHFSHPTNRILFDCINHFRRIGRPLELVAFTNQLRESSILDQLGPQGAYYVTQTWCNTAHSDMAAEYYAQILLEHHAKKQIAIHCDETKDEITHPMSESVLVIESAVKRLGEIEALRQPYKPYSDEDAFERMRLQLLHGEDPFDMIKTGIAGLDKDSQLRGSNMALIVGERKGGKTMLALSIALNVAKQALPVLYFSLEEAQITLRERLLCGLLRKRLMGLSTQEVNDGIAALRSLPIYFDDTSKDIREIESGAKESKALRGIRLIIVDYAQIVRVQLQKGANREQVVAEVSRSLRLLAMELSTSLIVLSQLNKEGTTRESMALEQDCTQCWRIEADDKEHGKGWLSVPFQRHGPGNISFPVTFLGEIGRIENFAEEK